MKTSESIIKFAEAFLNAQKAITFAAKDAENKHLKSRYADLEAVIDAIKPSLNDNGISFLQAFAPSADGKLTLKTRLIHVSGEWIEDELTMPLQQSTPQGYGSAATYSRRYALAAITGLYQADDDGETAQPSQKLDMRSDPNRPPQRKMTINAQRFSAGCDKIRIGEFTIEKMRRVYELTSQQEDALTVLAEELASQGK